MKKPYFDEKLTVLNVSDIKWTTDKDKVLRIVLKRYFFKTVNWDIKYYF